MKTFPVPIPFEGDQPLVLDPAAKGATADEEMSHIVDHIPFESDELVRILTSAVILFYANAGTFGECLRTAVIWERG